MKKRITIDLENDVYLRLAIQALHRGSKTKSLIENLITSYMNNPLRGTRQKVEAKASKEVNAATENNTEAKPAVKIVITEEGKSLYFLNGKRISKAAAEKILY
jgi:hypothetical protein